MKSGFVAAAILLVAGCASAPPVIQCVGSQSASATPATPALVGVSYGMQIAPIPLNTVVFSDPGLVELIAIQRVGASRTPTNTVEVTATLVNCSGAQVPLRVRTTFFDGEQRTTEAASAWKTVFVPPRGLGSYSESSISRERVSTYLIEIASLGPRT